MKVGIERKIYAAFGLALAVIFMIAGAAWKITARLDQTLRWADHTHEVLDNLEQMDTGLLEMQVAFRGFLIKPQPSFYDAYLTGAGDAAGALRRVRELTVDNSEQQRRLDQLAALIAATRTNMQKRIDLRRTHDLAAALLPATNPQNLPNSRRLIADMKAAELGLLNERSRRVSAAARTTTEAMVASGFFAAALLAIVVLMAQRDIAAGRATAAKIRALNEGLGIQNGRLEEANRELEAFSYTVSHDLRAPLRHIDGFSSLLRKQAVALDDTGRRYLDIISGAAQRMGKLIDDLLQFSRMGRAHLAVAEVDSDQMIAEIVRENDAGRNNRPIEWRIAPLPRVQGDSPMLRQVWTNLISNAVKFTGGVARPRIEIGGERSSTAAEYVFSVRDNGVGFDMKHVSQLFGVFHRLHAGNEFEGTGIGLAIVRRIVARHGGRTWAEGRVGEGACFYFSLPIHSPPHAFA